MNKSDFCHLHVHSIYSQLDGMGKIEDYVSKAKKLGHKYLACTDHGNIDGLIKFQKECLKLRCLICAEIQRISQYDHNHIV